MSKQDFVDLTDYQPQVLKEIINRSMELKSGAPPRRGKDKALAMIFTKPSTRTNVSFRMAMHRLGGTSMYLGQETLQLSRGETMGDTAKTLSRYVDVIMIRTFSHQDVIDLAAGASAPVINGLTDLLHPCQAMGDVLTLTEEKGDNYENLKMAYLGDGNNVCHSLINAAGLFGFELTISAPEQFAPDDKVLKPMQKRNPGIVVEPDPVAAVENADALYTDVWVSMGDEEEEELRRSTFEPYQVNNELLSHAKDDAIVLHCLPANRGEELTDEVMDGPQSRVFDQAENRMHSQQAILEYLLGTVD
ncbi:MAG: ornithine carbamoyltransferase [bacterium]